MRCSSGDGVLVASVAGTSLLRPLSRTCLLRTLRHSQPVSATIQRMNEIASVIAGSIEKQGQATQSIAQSVQHAAAGTAEVNNNIAAVTHVVGETASRAHPKAGISV